MLLILPCRRPTARDIENDPSIHVNSYTEYRWQKRQKMTADKEWLIWGRSPSPIDEPLLEEDDEPQGENPVVAGDRETDLDPAEADIDQEELRIFMCACAEDVRSCCDAVQRAVC